MSGSGTGSASDGDGQDGADEAGSGSELDAEPSPVEGDGQVGDEDDSTLDPDADLGDGAAGNSGGGASPRDEASSSDGGAGEFDVRMADEVSSGADQGCSTSEGMNSSIALRERHRLIARNIRGAGDRLTQSSGPPIIVGRGARGAGEGRRQIPPLASVSALPRPAAAARCRASIVTPDRKGRFKVTVAVRELDWTTGTSLTFELVGPYRLRLVTADDGELAVDGSNRVSLSTAAMTAVGLTEGSQLLLQADTDGACLHVTNTAQLEAHLTLLA